MPGWVKLLLALAVTGVLGIALVVGAVVWWVRNNKDRLLEDARTAQAEGKAFGAEHTRGECIDDSVARAELCKPMDLVCITAARLRLNACASVATDDGACKDVPGRTEVLKIALWQNRECERRGKAGSQACQNVMQGVVEACGMEKP
jgi:hypothetical protein